MPLNLTTAHFTRFADGSLRVTHVVLNSSINQANPLFDEDRLSPDEVDRLRDYLEATDKELPGVQKDILKGIHDSRKAERDTLPAGATPYAVPISTDQREREAHPATNGPGVERERGTWTEPVVMTDKQQDEYDLAIAGSELEVEPAPSKEEKAAEAKAERDAAKNEEAAREAREREATPA